MPVFLALSRYAVALWFPKYPELVPVGGTGLRRNVLPICTGGLRKPSEQRTIPIP
jgi:hypothetical protein